MHECQKVFGEVDIKFAKPRMRMGNVQSSQEDGSFKANCENRNETKWNGMVGRNTLSFSVQ